MHVPRVKIDIIGTLSIDKFKEMDYTSIDRYNIPIELMMENAGLNLARLSTYFAKLSDTILIGIGTGNNGGGGLVAARRLAGWGYSVYIHLPEKKLKTLPQLQLKRALSFGVSQKIPKDPEVFVDAYLGFSQRLPISHNLLKVIKKMNKLKCQKISLDLPTGFNKVNGELIFKPDIIITLAAMKTELVQLLSQTQIFIADLGLPCEIYKEFRIKSIPEFQECGIVECLE